MAYAMKGYQARAKKEYIATAPFNLKFFTYTVTGPTAAALTTTGLMTYVTGATAANCPAGRILREIGARIFPGANPGLQSGETGYNSVVTHGEHIFTKVFDAVTGFNGYIDANDAIFATYSNELPVEFVDDGETDGSTSRRGASVYTGGNVTAVGSVTAGGQIRSTTVTSATQVYSTGSAANAITIDPTLGQVHVQTFTITGGTNSFTITTTAVAAAGTVVYLILKTSGTHTTTANVAAGTNVKMNTVVLGTVASRTFGLTLVSDGSSLVQVGGDVVPVAMT